MSFEDQSSNETGQRPDFRFDPLFFCKYGEGQTIAQAKADLFVVKFRDILEIFLLLDIFPPLAEL